MSANMEQSFGIGPVLGRSAALARNWWALVLRGVFAIIFGVVALFWTNIAIASLLLVFAIYMLADGVFGVIAAVRAASNHGRWGPLLIEGLVDILVGLIALFMPIATVLAFILLAAAWALVSGGAMLWAAFGLHPTHGRWLLVLGGVISILWGVLLFLFPAASTYVLTWWFGAYALLFGIALIVAGFHLRRMRNA